MISLVEAHKKVHQTTKAHLRHPYDVPYRHNRNPRGIHLSESEKILAYTLLETYHHCYLHHHLRDNRFCNILPL